jgi:DNA-binding MurR/RpiR family transcriptional regulator
MKEASSETPAHAAGLKRGPPSDYAELRRRLAEDAPGRGPGFAQAANFIGEHPLEIALGSAISVAERCDISTASVVRLAQHLGFQGFADMRAFFRGLLRQLSDSRW